MIKYYKTTKQYIRINTENVDATFLYVSDDKKIKSDFVDGTSYQNLLNETIKQDSPWIEIDETTDNNLLV